MGTRIAWGGSLAIGLCLALSTVCAAAQTTMGLAVVDAHKGNGPVTVFYPSDAPAGPVTRGPFTLDVAWQGAPRVGNRRLVVISHGSGGAPWPFADLARTLVNTGFVVAVPEHEGDNYHDQRLVGPESWKRRPGEVIAAIDAVMATMARPRAAVGLIEAEQDRWLPPRFHIEAVRAACASCEVLADMKTAGHGSLFSPWPASLARSLTPLLVDPPGFDREELPAVYRTIAAFLARALVTGR